MSDRQPQQQTRRILLHASGVGHLCGLHLALRGRGQFHQPRPVRQNSLSCFVAWLPQRACQVPNAGGIRRWHAVPACQVSALVIAWAHPSIPSHIPGASVLVGRFAVCVCLCVTAANRHIRACKILCETGRPEDVCVRWGLLQCLRRIGQTDTTCQGAANTETQSVAWMWRPAAISSGARPAFQAILASKSGSL